MKALIAAYIPGQSPLHRCDPRLKFLFSLLFMVLIFFLSQPLSLLAYALFLGLLIALAKVPLLRVLRGLKPLFFIALLAFVINIFSVRGTVLLQLGPLAVTREGLALGLTMALRLAYLILTSSLLLTLTTSPLLLADGIEALFRPLARIGFPAHELAMMMSIALRFIPTLMEETDKIMKAQSSRGADYDSGRLMSRVRGMVAILIPLFVSAFKRADDLALAMEARCYRGGEGRTKLHVLHYQRLDAVLCSAFLALGLGLLLLEFALRRGF